MAASAQTGTAVVSLNGFANSIGGAITLTGRDPGLSTGAATTHNLTQAANLNFSGVAFTVVAGAANGNVTLNSANSGNTTFALTNSKTTSLKTNGTLGVSGTVAAGGSLLTDSGALNFGALTVNGSLNSTASGAVSQGAALVVTGATIFTAGANNITLSNGANNFASLTLLSANNVDVRDVDGIVLGASSIGGTLNLTAAGAITQSGALSVTGAAAITAAANDVVLNTQANDFSSMTIVSANNVALRDINALSLGSVAQTGNLNITATGTTLNGNIQTNGGSVSLAAAGAITLGNNITIDTQTTAATNAGAISITGTG